MLNDETMGFMLTHMKPNKFNLTDTKSVKVKSDVSEKEAMQIYNEIIDIYKSHNVSYQCACKLSLALNHAFMTGAVELYNRENP